MMSIEKANQFGKLYEEKLFKFEQEHLVQLPSDYRAFLLEFNGGCPSPEVIDFVQYGRAQSDIVNRLYGIHNGEYWANLEWHMEILSGRIIKGFLPIGDDPGGNFYLLGTTKEYFGQIYFWDHENEAQLHNEQPYFDNMSFIASSFTEFLNKLYTNPYE